jgi:hypothetical protein
MSVSTRHLTLAGSIALREVPRDDRERGHVERVDEQIEAEGHVAVVGQPLHGVTEHHERDAREPRVVHSGTRRFGARVVPVRGAGGSVIADLPGRE